MIKRLAAAIATATLSFALTASAQSTPNILNGTIQAEVGDPSCPGGWTGTVKGSVGKGTATFGCGQNTAYLPLQYIDPPRPGSLACYAMLTTLTLTTDKYPDGIDLNVTGSWCDGTLVYSKALHRNVRVPERYVGGFDGDVPAGYFWGTYTGEGLKDGRGVTIKFSGRVANH